ncbi:MAG: KamA family radical SAM protein [Clostridia bacterium]
MWKTELHESIRTISELKSLGYIGETEYEALTGIAEQFPIMIPNYYLSLIDKSDPNDPIKKMCVPSAMELNMAGSFDTSGEADNTVIQGLQHKYKNTALILSTNICAMYCRHCFRKRLVGLSEVETMCMMDDIVEYIGLHDEIDNVLISGGDALLNSNRVLEHILAALSEMEHLKFIRIGTRIPVVLPSRITDDDELRDILSACSAKKPLYIVTQFNHPRELTAQASLAVKQLNECGIIVNNQTVLLHGVNDNIPTLAKLLNKLTSSGVIPYYVFQCRPVAAVKTQFQVPFLTAIDIVEGAKAKVNGIAKRFKYVMSHPSGKIEIIGKIRGSKMVFKYHQPKYDEDIGRLFAVNVTADQCWLDEQLA